MKQDVSAIQQNKRILGSMPDWVLVTPDWDGTGLWSSNMIPINVSSLVISAELKIKHVKWMVDCYHKKNNLQLELKLEGLEIAKAFKEELPEGWVVAYCFAGTETFGDDDDSEIVFL